MKKGRGLHLSNLKIRSQLFVYFLITILIATISISLVSLITYSQSVQRMNIAFVQDSLASANASIDELLRRAENISYILFSNSDLQDILTRGGEGEYNVLVDTREILKILSNSMLGYSRIDRIHVLSTDDRIYSTARKQDNSVVHSQVSPETVRASALFRSLDGTRGSAILYTGDRSDAWGERNVFLARKLYSRFNSRDEIGYLFLEIPVGYIEDIYSAKSWNSQGAVAILDGEGRAVSLVSNHERITEDALLRVATDLAGNGDGSYDRIIERERCLVTMSSSAYTRWNIYSVLPYSHILSGWMQTRDLIVGVSLVAVLISLVLSLAFSARITKPIRELMRAMKRVGEGNFVSRPSSGRHDEIGELSDMFDDMTRHIDELIANMEREQTLKRESEIRLLQYQINPHFFYNTLDTINWLAQSAKEKKIETIITSLSRLFRISLSMGAEEIPLAQELEHVRCYLTIQKIRFGELFDYEIALDERISSVPILKMLLQPLAENALHHGLRDLGGGGLIRIEARRDRDDIMLVVMDNGAGMSEETKSALERYIRRMDGDEGEAFGFGLRNIQDRIKLRYGAEYGLSFDLSGEWTAIRIRIPIPQ